MFSGTVIACMGAIDPDPCSKIREIPYQRMKRERFLKKNDDCEAVAL
jgi:hypothetical protein